jgi:hypothetical protein
MIMGAGTESGPDCGTPGDEPRQTHAEGATVAAGRDTPETYVTLVCLRSTRNVPHDLGSATHPGALRRPGLAGEA